MTTAFNYTYDIAALFILASIFLLNVQQNFYKNKSYYLFNWICGVNVCITTSDIFSVIAMEKNMVYLFWFTNTVFYLSQQIAAYLFCEYLVAEVAKKHRFRVLRKIIFSIPFVVIILLILTNPVTHWIFNYNFSTGAYYYGKFQWTCYAVGLLYFGISFLFSIFNNALYNKRILFAYINSVFILAAFFAHELYRPYILTRGFSFALLLLQLFMVIIIEHPRKDLVTGLLSEKYFNHKLNILLHNKEKAAIILIRILDYDYMLNVFGKNNINLIEKEICNKIREEMPKNVGYRLSKDVVALLLDNIPEDKFDYYENRLDALMRQKWAANGMDFSFSHAVVSLRTFDDFSTVNEFDGILQYVEKVPRLSRGIVKLDGDEMQKVKRERDVEDVIRHNLEKKMFSMHYQPIYSLSSKKFTTAEALIRMNNSVLGAISPSEFIPIAERAGLIIPIGYWILDSVFKFIAENNLDIYGIEYIEVNLSIIQCMQRDLVTNIFKLKEKYNINPSKICFEINETTGAEVSDTFTTNVRALKDAGYKLAMDDFGKGGGNFDKLISTEYDIVKYGKGTTEYFYEEEKFHNLLGRMSTLLHAMKCEVVASGVETKEQLEYMEIMGVDYIQGYYFSKALSEKEFLDFIRMKN